MLLIGAQLVGLAAKEAGAAEPRELYVPDGQLRSHLFRVYVDGPLSWTNQPRLIFWGAHAWSSTNTDEAVPIRPIVVAAGQVFQKTTKMGQVGSAGTLLLFDLSKRRIMQPYKGAARVLPVLEWTELGSTNTLAASAPVNVGNIGMASLWMAVFVSILVAVVARLSRLKKQTALSLFIGDDGHGSLSRVQLACWTVAVGFSIGVFGLIKAAVPDIPSSLVALMGLSLVTGGVSYVAATKEGKPLPRLPEPRRFNFADLICTYDADGNSAFSIAKAQMLFWTGVALLLFMVKTFMQGELWDVPWELVTLTGMSQAAFVGPKFWKPLAAAAGAPMAADTGPGASRVPEGAAAGKGKEDK